MTHWPFPQNIDLTSIEEAVGLLDQWIKAYKELEHDWFWLKEQNELLRGIADVSRELISELIDRVIELE